MTFTRVEWRASLLLGAACGGAPHEVGTREAPLIDGDDDRVELYEVAPARRDLGAVTVAAWLPRSAYVDHDGVVYLCAFSAAAAHGLCSDERFAAEPSAAECSVVLVGARHVLTARHCIPSDATCAGGAFVFGNHYVAAGMLARIRSEDVYACRRVVSEYASALDAANGLALVELDRATARAPVTFAATEPQAADVLAPIGTPLGLPLKVDPNARVVDVSGGELIPSCERATARADAGEEPDADAMADHSPPGTPAPGPHAVDAGSDVDPVSASERPRGCALAPGGARSSDDSVGAMCCCGAAPRGGGVAGGAEHGRWTSRANARSLTRRPTRSLSHEAIWSTARTASGVSRSSTARGSTV